MKSFCLVTNLTLNLTRQNRRASTGSSALLFNLIMPPPLADRQDAERLYFQSKILRRCLDPLSLASQKFQCSELTPEQSAIHETYLAYIEPMIDYDFIDVIVRHRRSRSRRNQDDFTLLQDIFRLDALTNTTLMRHVVKKWTDDQELKNSLERLQEHISAVCTYELCKSWGHTDEAHKDYQMFLYDDWLAELPQEDAERSRRIALCTVVLLGKSYYCDVSAYPNLQAGIKDIVTGRHIMKPEPVLDLT